MQKGILESNFFQGKTGDYFRLDLQANWNDSRNRLYCFNINSSKSLEKALRPERQTDIAKTIGFESNDEYNEIMFLREITHTINAFNEMADIVRLYSKKPKTAEQRLANLLSEVLYEDSESV